MEVVYLEVLGKGCRSQPGPVCRDAASYDILQAHRSCESSNQIIVQRYYSANLQTAYTDVSQLIVATSSSCCTCSMTHHWSKFKKRLRFFIENCKMAVKGRENSDSPRLSLVMLRDPEIDVDICCSHSFDLQYCSEDIFPQDSLLLQTSCGNAQA